jgi:hypothetical protein
MALSLSAAIAEATTYAAFNLHQRVELSDVIVVGTVMDPQRGVVRVDEVLKGTPEKSFQLVDHVDTLIRETDRRPLVKGTQELFFLKRQDSGYTPVQKQLGRWLVRRHDAVEMPVDASLRPLPDLRRTIAALVSLQAAARDGAPAVNAFLTGLASPDPEVKLWAAHHGYLRITDPPAELVNAYLALWSSGDAEILAATANAVIAWRVRRAGPMMAAALREGSEAERANAARALGGAGDLSFLPQLRTSARSDSATIVRSSAYQGLALLLGGESLNDLDRGARDPQPLVRRIVAASAANVGRNSTDPTLRARVRRLLTLLGEDRSAEVRVSAQYAMRLLADPAPNRTAR